MAIRKVFVRSAYNYNADDVSRETGSSDVDGESLTQQSFKEECDINTIVRRFGLTGTMPQGIVPPTYQSFEGIFDFHTAMNAIAQARESFDAMPAEVRLRFKNDPQAFVEFCSDKKNLKEMRDMGLAIPEVIADTTSVPDVPVKEKANVGDSKGGTGGSDQKGSEPAKAGGSVQGGA